MKTINYVISLGYRCNSVQFLQKYGLKKFNGPFDWMYIDIESALDNISSEFLQYLENIVILQEGEFAYKNVDTINPDIVELKNQNLSYMAHNYNKTKLPINQKFTKPTGTNIYEWSKICIFLHHDLEKPEESQKFQRRIDRFKELEVDKLLLFYISKIIKVEPIVEIERILNLVKEYKIESNITLVLCFTNQEEFITQIENCLFIIKNVPDYDSQMKSHETDNNLEWSQYGMQGLNFDKEYDIIKQYYNFDLKDKVEI